MPESMYYNVLIEKSNIAVGYHTKNTDKNNFVNNIWNFKHNVNQSK